MVIAPAMIAITLAITATTALAASTRAEYVAQTDPICQAGNSREKTVLRSLKKSVGELRKRGIDTTEPTKPVVHVARRYYGRLVSIARNVIGEISLVAPAPGDEGTVSQWLQLSGQSVDLFQRGIDAFAHGKSHRYKQLMTKSSYRRGNADYLVRDFGFRYCA
jgi:hypothetical protein